MGNTLLQPTIVASRTEVPQIHEIWEKLPTGSIYVTGAHGETISLPSSVEQAFRRLIELMSYGKAVSLVPTSYELTTQEAADFLNVSRPFCVKLLEKGEIPFHKVGAHRRIYFQDLMKYKQERDTQRGQDLKELTQMSKELGFYKD